MANASGLHLRDDVSGIDWSVSVSDEELEKAASEYEQSD